MFSKQQAQQTISQNKQDSSTIAYRLDTENLKNQIKIYLGGYEREIRVDPETGEKKGVWKTNPSLRKMNDRGIQSVMSLIEMNINSAVVQGNLDRDDWIRMTADFHEELLKHLFLNQRKYELHNNDLESVVESCFQLVKKFTSRTVGDGERESYKNTMSVNENQTVEQNRASGLSRIMNGVMGGGN